MLKIHKPFSNKLLTISITSILGIGVLLGLSALTYAPESSYAESITYDPIPKYHPNLTDITYMQDMTEQVCQNSYENDTKQLIDKRDDKAYWVTKLKDGNCWMTQNLDLDISASGLTAELSDITTDWNSTTNRTYPPVTTQTGTPRGFINTSNATQGYNVILSYDAGVRICAGYGQECVTPATEIYDAHYLQGNFYTFNTATAGQGYAKNSGNVENSSICPKEWRLPAHSESPSFNTLFTSYGVNNGLLYGAQDIRLNPLYFIYSGFAGNNALNFVSSYGYYWTSTASNRDRAYLMFFDTSVTPSNSNARYLGLSVRCVARGAAIARPAIPLNNNVTVHINPQLSLDVANEATIEKTETNPSTANLDVKVSSNQKYTLGISADNPNLTSTTNNVTIPAKSDLLNTPENGWGIKKAEDTSYTALTTSPQTFYTASGAEIKTIPFTIGISTAPNIPNGEYSTNITITATQN